MVELQDRRTALIAFRPDRENSARAALQARFGLALPAMNAFTEADGAMLARTAPHQALAMRDDPGLFASLEETLSGVAAVFDLSDARTAIRISGAEATRTMRALFPLDLRALRPGRCAQTVMAHLTVLVCQRDDAPTYELFCASSYRGSFLRALRTAS